jgi:pimeloyl-ACP methyl ester carboxylesterase
LLSTFGSPSPATVVDRLGSMELPLDGLARNRVPALFVVGERDAIFPPDIVGQAAAYLGASRLEVIADSGHSPYFERPEAGANTVDKFLRSLGDETR